MCSVSIVCLFLSLPLSSVSLTPANSSLQFQRLFLSFLDFRVQYQRLSLPCFQFIALAFILQRSRSTFPVPIPCRLRFQSFVYSLFHLVSHVTDSDVPRFWSPTFRFGVTASPFYLGVSSHVPRTIHGLVFLSRRTSWLLPRCGFEDPRKTSFPSRRTSWLLPPSGVEDPCKTSLSSPLFRLGQSLCISPPIVHRPFEFPLSCVVSFHRISYLPFLRLPYSRYPFFVISFCLLSFGFSSLCRFLVVLLIATYPTSFRLFLRYFRYPLSPVCLLFRFRLSFVFYSPYTSWLFSVSAFVSSLIALSIPVLFSIVSSFFPSYLSSFVPSSFGIPLSLSSTCLPSVPCHHPSSPVSFLLRLLFRFSHLVVCVPVFECALSVHVLVLWFNPSQLSLSSSVSAFVSILAN